MPVTRSQRNIATKQAVVPIVSEPIPWSKLFCDRVKNLLMDCEKAEGEENKMKVVLQIYRVINKDLDRFIKIDGEEKWMRFLCTIFNKIVEFETEYQRGSWHGIDKNLVKTLLDELNTAKKYTINLIKNYYGNAWIDVVSKTKEKIASLECQRPRRNIPRVDYTGMDSIEPECEFDGITDIWFDESLWYDSDYEPSDDEDEDDDIEDYVDE